MVEETATMMPIRDERMLTDPATISICAKAGVRKNPRHSRIFPAASEDRHGSQVDCYSCPT
jgi:hypothetical protein